MPAGRKKSAKSPIREPPPLSPQTSLHSPCLPDTPHRDFECFVRESLTEIRASLSTMGQRIDRLETNINASIEFERKRIGDLERKTRELEKLTEKMAFLEASLKVHSDKLNKLERFSRRNNIRFIGVPQDTHEDCLTLTKKVLKEKFDLPDVKLERAHRDGPKIPGKPQHLLVKLNCYQDKVQVLRQQRQALADVPFFCVEDLTHQDLQEKRRWSTQVSQAYQDGKRYRFVAGKWRDHGGALAAFYRE